MVNELTDEKEFSSAGLTPDPSSNGRQPGEVADEDKSVLDPKNIVFVGEGEPPLALHGVFKAQLPDAETQRSGFYHEKAREIIQHFPSKYKRMVKLGDR
jgi:hypothetical protein